MMHDVMAWTVLSLTGGRPACLKLVSSNLICSVQLTATMNHDSVILAKASKSPEKRMPSCNGSLVDFFFGMVFAHFRALVVYLFNVFSF